MLNKIEESIRTIDKKICLIDSTHKTYLGKNRKKDKNIEHWYHYKNGYICKNCYMKLFQHPKWNHINNPKRTKEQRQKYNKNGVKRLCYKYKSIYLRYNPRTGYCSCCRNNIYDRTCKWTHLHHIQYHDNDPLKDTIELCISCHGYETQRQLHGFMPQM